MQNTIRLANTADIDAIFHIRTSVQENHLSREQLTEMGITPGAIEQALVEAPCIWIAEVDGVPAGFSMADSEDACVFAAFVLPSSRGRGWVDALWNKQKASFFSSMRRSGWKRRRPVAPAVSIARSDGAAWSSCLRVIFAWRSAGSG